MMDNPKTKEEAETYRYAKWAGNPRGFPYRPGYCAFEVFSNWSSYQCTRKAGHGPAGLYCKQHAMKVNEGD